MVETCWDVLCDHGYYGNEKWRGKDTSELIPKLKVFPEEQKLQTKSKEYVDTRFDINRVYLMKNKRIEIY